MFDLSGILKKYQESKQHQQESPVKPEQPFPVPGSSEKMNLSDVIGQTFQSVAGDRARDSHQAALAVVRRIYTAGGGDLSGVGADLITVAGSIADCIDADSVELVRRILVDYPEEENYLFAHATNTGILSIILAKYCGLDNAQRIEAGMAGFLHDAGLMRYRDVIQKPGPLTEQEFAQVKEHPGASVEMLEQIKAGLPQYTMEAITQHHERMDGSGYPQGLKGDALCSSGRIAAVADVWEALTHWRPYRASYTPSEALKTMLDQKAGFDRAVMKPLIEHIGIFPPGALVQLNTKEIALVTRLSQKSPFRPVVTILFDVTGKKLAEPKQIDLSTSSVVYVEECVRAHMLQMHKGH